MLHFAHTLCEAPLLGQGVVALAYCVSRLDTCIPPDGVSSVTAPWENPRVATGAFQYVGLPRLLVGSD
jgi:hypothetical protein